MSTILDALEKANRARAAQGQGPLAAGPSVRERQLAEQAERERRHKRVLLVVMLLTVVLLLGAGGTIMALVSSRPDPAPPAASVAMVAITPTPAVTPVETPAPAPTPVPTPPPPTPTPEPTPTPRPTPSPTPAHLMTPVPPRFSESQVVYPADLGIKIEGALVDGANSTIVIDGNLVDIGRKYKGVRPLAIKGPLIEAEVDQPGGPVTLFIRFK